MKCKIYLLFLTIVVLSLVLWGCNTQDKKDADELQMSTIIISAITDLPDSNQSQTLIRPPKNVETEVEIEKAIEDKTEEPTLIKETIYLPLCDCDICESLLSGEYSIEHPLSGRTGKITTNARSCTDLQLVKKAIYLFIDLDNDFDNTINQIKFGHSPYAEKFLNINSELNSIADYVSLVFENDLYAILNINIEYDLGEAFEPPLFIINFYTSFKQRGRADGLCVEFIEIDGEWMVNNLYSDMIWS